MGHTPAQIIEAGNRHTRLTAFLDVAYTGTADMTVGARPMGKGREQQISVPRDAGQAVVDWAIDQVRKLEVEFGINAWKAPKAVHGKPEAKNDKGK